MARDNKKCARKHGNRTELVQNGGLSLGHSYATITMPDSFRVLLERHEQKQYEHEFPIRRPDGSEVDGKEEDDER